jgi:O-antigen/teichoic acid export membrane protein
MAVTGALIRNYGLATIATALVSGSHFLLQIAVLQRLGPAEFGLTAFVMTMIQFGSGLCNAVVAAPYTLVVADGSDETAVAASFYVMNIVNALGIGLLSTVLVVAIGDQSLSVAVPFGLAAAFYGIRWFGRTRAYTQRKPTSAAQSDLIYALTVVAGVTIMWLAGTSLLGVASTFVAASVASLFPFGLEFLRRHRAAHALQAFRSFGPVWREHARWALVGLVTTEATANSHAYIVTTISGPAGFAPLATAMLFMRPVGVCMVSLTQLERPAFAKAFAQGQLREVAGINRRFTAVLVAITLATMLLAVVLFQVAPSLIFKPGLVPSDVIAATAIWSAIMLVLCIQTPRNVLLQAAGRFYPLAKASIHSCGVTILAVLLLVYAYGPVYSALGVLAGQLVMTIDIFLQSRRLLAGRAAAT